MANHKAVPPKEHQFKKGHKPFTNTGKSKLQIEVDRQVKDEKILFKAFMLDCMRLEIGQLQKVIDDKNSSAFNKMCAHLAKKAGSGDQEATKFVIERLFGKVKEFDEAGPVADEDKVYVIEMTESGKFKHATPQLVDQNTIEIEEQ